MSQTHRLRSLAIAGLIVGTIGIGTGQAQMPGGAGGPLAPGAPMTTGQGLHPPVRTQEIAPPALPGAAGVGNISAGPVTTSNENPTKLLFSAINHGDYTQARAAVSRGADLNARNALDETPIELAVELNRNNITFMLLSVRAEESPDAGHVQPVSARPTTGPTRRARHAMSVPPIETRSHAVAAAPDQPGIPNPAAGFLGFGHS